MTLDSIHKRRLTSEVTLCNNFVTAVRTLVVRDVQLYSCTRQRLYGCTMSSRDGRCDECGATSVRAARRALPRAVRARPHCNRADRVRHSYQLSTALTSEQNTEPATANPNAQTERRRTRIKRRSRRSGGSVASRSRARQWHVYMSARSQTRCSMCALSHVMRPNLAAFGFAGLPLRHSRSVCASVATGSPLHCTMHVAPMVMPSVCRSCAPRAEATCVPYTVEGCRVGVRPRAVLSKCVEPTARVVHASSPGCC